MYPRTALVSLLLACPVALATTPAEAAVALELASILAIEDDSGWHLRVDLEGSSDVTSATLTPPDRPAVGLACEPSGGGGTECDFESADVVSLAALLTAYPSGEYALALNGGARTASLTFDPVEPDGLVTVTNPADGATSVDDTPGIAWTHECTNCLALLFEIEELAAPIDVGLEHIASPPVSPGAISWSQLESYEGPKPASLPDGVYELQASAAAGEITTEQLAPGGEGFEYSQGALREVRSTFTVPEPGALASALAVLAALGAAAVRR